MHEFATFITACVAIQMKNNTPAGFHLSSLINTTLASLRSYVRVTEGADILFFSCPPQCQQPDTPPPFTFTAFHRHSMYFLAW